MRTAGLNPAAPHRLCSAAPRPARWPLEVKPVAVVEPPLPRDCDRPVLDADQPALPVPHHCAKRVYVVARTNRQPGGTCKILRNHV